MGVRRTGLAAVADGDEGVVGGADGLALGGLAVHEDERVLRAWSGLGLGLGLKLGLGFGFGFGLGLGLGLGLGGGLGC